MEVRSRVLINETFRWIDVEVVLCWKTVTEDLKNYESRVVSIHNAMCRERCAGNFYEKLVKLQLHITLGTSCYFSRKWT